MENLSKYYKFRGRGNHFTEYEISVSRGRVFLMYHYSDDFFTNGDRNVILMNRLPNNHFRVGIL